MNSEIVTLEGHIIDSLILAKVLDTILQMGGTFDLTEVKIGETREESSRAKIRVQAETQKLLEDILRTIQSNGARVEQIADCLFEPTPRDGVLPNNFYATSHLPTQVRLHDQWIDVESIEMDLAILITLNPPTAQTIPMAEVKRGDLIVVGRTGVRVFPLERPKERDVFGFMEAQVSSEWPHQPIIIDVARRMAAIRDNRISHRDANLGDKVLLVGGPAIVHSDGREAVSWLIQEGYIHTLFCGNALAAHDMEASLFGTSLGFGLRAGCSVPHGHEHHLRTITVFEPNGAFSKQ